MTNINTGLSTPTIIRDLPLLWTKKADGEGQTLHVETYEVKGPSLDEQVKMAADLAKGLRSGDPAAHQVVSVEASQALLGGQGGDVKFEIPQGSELEPGQLKTLEQAGVKVTHPSESHGLMHAKMLIFDDGSQHTMNFGKDLAADFSEEYAKHDSPGSLKWLNAEDAESACRGSGAGDCGGLDLKQLADLGIPVTYLTGPQPSLHTKSLIFDDGSLAVQHLDYSPDAAAAFTRDWNEANQQPPTEGTNTRWLDANQGVQWELPLESRK